MAGDLQPLLALLAPTLYGVDTGLQQGAGNVKAAVQNTGVALNQAADGVADIVAHTAVGAGKTIGQVPAAVHQTVQTIDRSPGVIGSADRTLFGQSQSNES